MSVLRAEEQADYGSCRNRRTLGEMLHFILSILLGILKIIGILLLTVLVLLLLVLSAILFGPVRYRIRAAKTEEALEAAVTVSWLHLIRARLLVDGRKQTHALDIRIFAISRLSFLFRNSRHAVAARWQTRIRPYSSSSICSIASLKSGSS